MGFSGIQTWIVRHKGEHADHLTTTTALLKLLMRIEFICSLGVHFMMADGGFSVDGQENIQEILSKQLYLCQFLVALSIVRTGGHFVCKLFDLFTPFRSKPKLSLSMELFSSRR